MDISTMTIAKARKALDAKEFSAVDLAKSYLAEIEKRNAGLNVYLEVFDDVLEQAKRADEIIAAGKAGPLTGIPIAVKDNILIKGRKASAASKILNGYVASYDSNVTEKLNAQGVVYLGRANMDEFAMGGSTENSAFGPTKNPRDVSRVPGGSSGGSAAAVAGNLALAALGSDTGGSIRQPAALTGIVGLKPTYGAVSRHGLMAMGSSLDQIGPLTKTVEDTKIIFDAIRGHDKRDGTSLPDYSYETSAPKKIGVPRAFLQKGVDADVLECFEATLEKLKAQGHEIIDVEMPNLDYALPAYYIVMPAEASTNLSRFDGIRFGHSVKGETVDEIFSKTRADGFGPEVRRRILVGAFVLSSGYYDAYYGKAQAARAMIVSDFTKAFEKVDVVATPTTPQPAFKIGEKEDPLAMYAADIFTVSINLAGTPAISVPMGTVDRNGSTLPLGIQFIAPFKKEGALFAIGHTVESVA